MDIGTNQRIGGLAMRYGRRSQRAPLDCTSSRRSTVMRALPRATGVTTGYQRDSSSKRPMSSVTLVTRARLGLWNLTPLWTLKTAPTAASLKRLLLSTTLLALSRSRAAEQAPHRRAGPAQAARASRRVSRSSFTRCISLLFALSSDRIVRAHRLSCESPDGAILDTALENGHSRCRAHRGPRETRPRCRLRSSVRHVKRRKASASARGDRSGRTSSRPATRRKECRRAVGQERPPRCPCPGA